MGNNPLNGPAAPLNEDNLPIRPDKEACLYYLNTGTCKSGTQCIFHHPPKGQRDNELKKSLNKAGMPAPPSGGGMLLPPMPGMDGPPPMLDAPQATGPPPAGMSGMLEKLEALQAEAKGDAPKDGGGAAPPAPMPQMTMRPPEPVKEVEYNDEGLPIRPGMQKCSYYLRQGKCTYGPNCRFDHPAGLGGLMSGGAGVGHFPGMIGGPMTEGGMAMRPGRDQCPFLSRTGSCPFGPECRFDHSGKPPAPAAPGAEGEAAEPAVSKPEAKAPEPEMSRKKQKGLGGTKGKRPPQNFNRQGQGQGQGMFVRN